MRGAFNIVPQGFVEQPDQWNHPRVEQLDILGVDVRKQISIGNLNTYLSLSDENKLVQLYPAWGKCRTMSSPEFRALKALSDL